jgi:ribosomal protein S1
VEVDAARKRISLSMKDETGIPAARKKQPETETNIQDQLKKLQGKWK